MRIVIALLLLVHGFAHLVGFVVPWKLATLDEVSYKTTILAGSIDVGAVWARVLGAVWLVIALAFTATGIGLLLGASGWLTAGWVSVVSSLVMCAAGWPEARLGVVANALVLAFVATGLRLSWLP